MPIQDDILDLTKTIGKAGLSALFPYEFEYYVITLELTDSKGKTIEYLTFPITPEAIDHVNKRMVTIKKTAGGVTALNIEGFIPQPVTISGTFGRKLKLLINQAGSITNKNSTNNGSFGETDKGLEIKTAILSSQIKTGYGTTKVLEAIVNKSTSLDEYNRPNRLYFYSPAQGHSWLIAGCNLTLHQDVQSSNMLWKYTLSFTAIAPVYGIKGDENSTSLLKATKFSVLQRAGDILTRNIKRAIF